MAKPASPSSRCEACGQRQARWAGRCPGCGGLGAIAATGRTCLLASGEESRAQVAARAERLGVDAEVLTFVPGRQLAEVLDAARDTTPFLLAVDSIQAIRDPDGGQVPGGVAQV